MKLSEKSRHAIHHSIDTKITITQIEKSPIYQLDVITDDRHGLLSLISDQLSKEDISINHAKINTLGFRAEDTFLISNKNNKSLSKIKKDNLIRMLKASIK
jgi:[protein-PII] uridylyltransferase